MGDHLLYIIALTKVPHVGPIGAKTLLKAVDNPEDIFNLSVNEILAIPGLNSRTAKAISEFEPQKAMEEEMNFIDKNKIQPIFYKDELYPSRLRHQDDAPVVMYFKGTGDLNAHRTVGVVGTRRPTEYGRASTDALIEALQPYNPTIISGMAYGIDTAAHRKSVELEMNTIGVLGHGLDRLYPAENRKLAEKMLEKGGLLTEFPINTKPDREHFPMRNRIIAGLCDVVVVVESKKKGGSMITADLANQYNKDVFAFPGRVGDEISEGCNLLIKSHRAALIESASDIGYVMRWEKQSIRKNKQSSLFPEISPAEQKIIDTMRMAKEMTIDHIHYKVDLPISEVSSLLLQLEFKGLIRSLPGKKYRVS